MKKMIYSLSTLLIGLFIHLVFHQFLSLYGIYPQLLLLLVICHGFLVGPLMGTILGFVWGMMLDSMGINFFGMQSLIFSVAGYISGRLRKRVANERPSAQLVVGAVASVYYFASMALIKLIIVGDHQSVTFILMILGTLFNVLLVIAVFWISEKWLSLWGIEQERV